MTVRWSRLLLLFCALGGAACTAGGQPRGIGPGSLGGSGVVVSNASPTIDFNIITANRGCDGVGINVSFGSPLITNNQITGNVRTECSGGLGGAGIKVSGASAAVIESNFIADNSLTGGNGGGISLFAAGAPVIRNNRIVRNSVSGVSPAARGGGIYIVNQSDALIVQNLIVGNSAGEGGGVYWLVPSGARGPRLVNNTMVDNQATVAGQGSAVFADGFDVNAVLVNNILVAPAGQTALHCGNFNDPNSPVIQFNDVFTPGGPAYGGICTNQTGINGNLSADPAFVAQQGNDFSSVDLEVHRAQSADIAIVLAHGFKAGHGQCGWRNLQILLFFDGCNHLDSPAFCRLADSKLTCIMADGSDAHQCHPSRKRRDKCHPAGDRAGRKKIWEKSNPGK